MLRIILSVLIFIFLGGCSRVPITNRKQVNLLPESQMIGMSTLAYDDFLSKNSKVSTSKNDAQMVSRVGKRIADAVELYLKKHGSSDRVKGFNWEFNLVDNDQVNAWAMPGGKVVVYTGILPITKDEVGLAVVMGHEVAHAIARHGNERMSQQLLIQGGGLTLSALLSQKPNMANDIFLQSYGVASGVGALAFSRKNESEADHMGLIFMAMAGYDPREAPKFWTRMSQNGGGKPPEILSTHPSDERRISDINEKMDEALKYYKK